MLRGGVRPRSLFPASGGSSSTVEHFVVGNYWIEYLAPDRSGATDSSSWGYLAPEAAPKRRGFDSSLPQPDFFLFFVLFIFVSGLGGVGGVGGGPRRHLGTRRAPPRRRSLRVRPGPALPLPPPLDCPGSLEGPGPPWALEPGGWSAALATCSDSVQSESVRAPARRAPALARGSSRATRRYPAPRALLGENLRASASRKLRDASCITQPLPSPVLVSFLLLFLLSVR